MIGRRLAEFRESVGVTQVQLGEILGISQKTVSAIENNRQNITSEILLVLSEKYDLSSTWVLTGRGDMFISPEKNALLIQEEIDTMIGYIEDFATKYRNGEIPVNGITKKKAELFNSLLEALAKS